MTNYHLRPMRFFEPVRPLLERYFAEIGGAGGEIQKAELSMEAEERLAQLDYLIDRVTALQDRAQAMGEKKVRLAQELIKYRSDPQRFLASPENLELKHLSSLRSDVVFELKLFAEAFYYFGWRLIRTLRQFRHFEGFDSPGVRNVRNHLVEHPENATSGITQQNWAFGGDTGPSLKNIRQPGKSSRRPGLKDVPLDAGMFVNAAELRDRLIARLQGVLPPLPGKAP